ncbi:alpha/beta fold hydrolase [Rhizorhapis sp. SPR117]|uniref:alpha/beta fold hydrolase n=1 Tax=Rhizorhapis sp. SPR117 TaxID=2912611 RepID=UPI001F2C1547|nr:alpha/beta fold hydrolase [Rhizorhapis sp. SPR117]
MATFLMIHGAWHSGWCFDSVRPLLEAAGHKVIAPTLPGAGGSDEELAAVTLAKWSVYTADLACAQAEPVILCGHSRGGLIISEAAERAPEAISALIYISGFLVPAGKSMNQMIASAGRPPEFERGLSLTANGRAVSLSKEAASAAFYNACSEQDREKALMRLVPEPLAPLATPLDISEANFGSVPRHYIECALDRAVPLSLQRSMQAALPCVSTTTLESDHSPFLCCPQDLVTALDHIAQSICSTGSDPPRGSTRG